MRRLFTILAWLGLAAWAACGDRPYTVETARGLAAGYELQYQGGILTLERACLESEDFAFEAPVLRVEKATGKLQADEPQGEVQGWKFWAERLEADGNQVRLLHVRFERGKVSVRAEEAVSADEELRLKALEAEAPGYRFRAREGVLQDDRFVALRIFASPCRQGEALGISGERAVFEPESGRLLLEESRVRYYGLCLARPQKLLLDVNHPPKLAFPLRFGLADGLTFGIVDLPLPEEGVPLGAEQKRLTLLAESIGGKAPGVRVALTAPEGWARFRVRQGDFSLGIHYQGLELGFLEGGKRYLEYAPEFTVLDLQLTPFGVLYGDPQSLAGLGGIRVGLTKRGRWGKARLTLAPYLRAVVNSEPAAWVAYGGSATLRWSDFSLSLSGTGLWQTPSSFWGKMREHEWLKAQAAYREFSLEYHAEYSAGWSTLTASYQGPFWLRVRKGFDALDDRLEVSLGYRAPTPPPWGVSVSPSFGYDLGLEKLARVGLTAAFADGCLVYRLGFQWVFEPWPGEREGIELTAGVALP